MSDIEKSFNFLHDNIPGWFKTIKEIEAKVVTMQNEIAKIPTPNAPMKRKTNSIESIRDLDAVATEPATEPASSAAAQQGPLATRKRKPGSLLSGQQSSAPNLRSRRLLLVYYDGEIQKSFETLVRSIGTGRNFLRKGKMEAKMNALAELAGSDDDDDEDDDDAIMSKISYRHRTGLSSMRSRATALRTGRSGSSGTPVELFDVTDKQLEQAQSLCEKGAHQILRDGDCRKELNGVHKYFEDVFESAKKEVAKSAARKEQDAVKAPQEAPITVNEPKLMAPITSSIPAPLPESKPSVPEIRPAAGITPATSKFVDIEVDDEEEEDDLNFVMPPIRLTSRAA